MSVVAPRVVLVTRQTEYERLLAHHGTRAQASFFLAGRGQDIDLVERAHQRFDAAVALLLRAVPLEWRRTRIDRRDLDRFLFEPDDTVVAVGQDGLVANLAKYLHGQPVLGVNPDPLAYDGVLVSLSPDAASALLRPTVEGHADTRSLTMVEAVLDDGQSVQALNEVFVGHASHQSARYRLLAGKHDERQSSSGIVVATGTGGTGWARSICMQRRMRAELPEPCERRLAYFVREAFPSIATGTSLVDGSLDAQERLEIVSEMNDGGVVFGDGMEGDHLEFHFGMRLSIGVADRALELVKA